MDDLRLLKLARLEEPGNGNSCQSPGSERPWGLRELMWPGLKLGLLVSDLASLKST